MDAGVSDEGLPRVAKTEDGDENVGEFFDKLVPALTIRSGVRCASLHRKANRVLDGQGGEMNVVLGRVLNITAVVSRDLLRG